MSLVQKPGLEANRLAYWGGRELDEDSAWGHIIRSLSGQGHIWVAGRISLLEQLSPAESADFEVFPSDILKHFYLEIPITTDAARAFSDFSTSAMAAEHRQVAMAMLSRRDDSGTFRVVDREVVIRRLNVGLISQLQKSKPTHIIFEETPHEIVDYTLYVLARWMGVRTLFFQPTSMGPQLLPRTSVREIFPVETWRQDHSRISNVGQRALKVVLAEFENIVNGNRPSSMDHIHNEAAKSRDLLTESKKLIRLLGRTIPNGSVSPNVFTGHGVLSSPLLVVLNEFLKRSLEKAFEKAALSLPDMSNSGHSRRALFALHYEPERTTLPEGLPWISQLDAVLAARAFLPDNVTLFVKEHFTQSSGVRPGYIGRSLHSYDFLSSVPGIRLLSAHSNVTKLKQRFEVIFTVTGKVGIEMPVKGIPVVFFGNPWWEGAPGTYKFDAGLRFHQVSRFQKPSAQEVFSWFTEFNTNCGFGLGSRSPREFELRNTSLPQDHAELEFKSLLRIIEEFLSPLGTDG